MVDVDVAVAAACRLQYIIIVAAYMLFKRKCKRRQKYLINPWIRLRNISGECHSLFDHLLTMNMQSFQNFMWMDFVAFQEFTTTYTTTTLLLYCGCG